MEKQKKSKVVGIITSILVFALGVVALFLPEVAGSALTTFLGAFLLASGVMMFVMAFTTGAVAFGAFLFGGIISFILGILLIQNPNGFLKVIAVIFAVFAILSGVFKVLFGLQCIAMRNKHWFSELIFGALYIVVAVLIFVYLNRANFINVLAYCFGAYLIVLGISKFIDNITDDTPKYEFKVSHDFKLNKEKPSKKEFSNEEEVVDADFSEKK